MTEKLANWIILIVDDDPKGLHIMQMLLSHYGAEVLTGTNGEEGVTILEKNHPDLIISDLSMPVLDGWGMIKAIKNNRPTADIPIIALTAHAMTGDREKAIEAGCHNYLTKPINPQTFVDELILLIKDVPAFAHRL